MTTIKTLLSLILIVFLGACTTQSGAVREIQDVPDYTLGIGDVVKITVYGHQDLSGDFTIEPDGVISFPLIRDVPAAGYTADELENTIAAKLSPEYIVDAKVSAEVQAFRSMYILGEVKNPGKYEYVPNMTLLQAIAIAGGYTYRANENNADVTRHVKGALKTFTVDDKTMLKPGDTVVVNRRWF